MSQKPEIKAEAVQDPITLLWRIKCNSCGDRGGNYESQIFAQVMADGHAKQHHVHKPVEPLGRRI